MLLRVESEIPRLCPRKKRHASRYNLFFCGGAVRGQKKAAPGGREREAHVEPLDPFQKPPVM